MIWRNDNVGRSNNNPILHLQADYITRRKGKKGKENAELHGLIYSTRFMLRGTTI